MSSNAHVPVLLGPVLEGLNVKQDGIYVDGTFGRGGHSSAILKQLNADGRLIAIDRDPQAIASAAPVLRKDPRLALIRGDFAELATHIDEKGWTGRVDGCGVVFIRSHIAGSGLLVAQSLATGQYRTRRVAGRRESHRSARTRDS